MKLKKILALVFSISLFVTSFSACSSAEKNGSNDDMKTIAIVAKGESHAFWVSVKQGAEDAAKKHGGYKITFRGPVSETSQELPAQKEMVQTALINNPDGFIVATIGEGFTDMLEQAYDKKIPVVQFDSGVWEADINALNEKGKNPIVSTVATSNETAAGLAACNLFNAIKTDVAASDGNYVIGVIQHDQTDTGVDRAKGFIDEFTSLADNELMTKGKYRFEKIVKDGDSNNAYVDALNALVEKGADAIFMTNEGVVKQVSDAIAANSGKYDDIKFCGFDAGTKQIEWMKSDSKAVLVGSVAQDSYRIGYDAVEQCIYAIEGGKVAENVPVLGKWYDKENIDEMIKQNLVYEG
jgi:ribose transport system substrate-binding protein